MATLTELARQHTTLSREDIDQLHRLLAEWGMLADLCFADLLLYAPAGPDRFVVLGHVRPVTAQTIYQDDFVGEWASDTARPLLERALASGQPVEGEIRVASLAEPVRMLAIPVTHEGRRTAVLTREWNPRAGRQPGQLERTYLQLFDRFVTMTVEGRFPFPALPAGRGPRVGDGVIALDAEGRVEYASPNAVSALHRIGIRTNAIGLTLAELGVNDEPVRHALDTGAPVLAEFEQSPGVVLSTRCIPLLAASAVTGGLFLVRDVSELRRRDRMILSRDATIREIHHRVKNNLQTISSLLRLQARRLSSPEAKAAIAESVRRIRTIALVHESLSQGTGEEVSFNEIVRPLARLAEEGLQSPDRPVRFKVAGDGGRLPAITATPLSVVLTELLQNAVDHAFNGEEQTLSGTVLVDLANDGHHLTVRVVDDGVGLPDGFTLEGATGLGLSIVRTLVLTELAGTITMRGTTPTELAAYGLAGGPERRGTLVEVVVPLESGVG
jgi:two-component sensor histidine kinase